MKARTRSTFWLRLIAAAPFLPGCLGIAVQPIPHDLTKSVDVCTLVESVTKVYVIEPIYINTYVQQNTTFSVNDYLTITVDNAPTSFDSVVRGTSTTLITSSYSM